jgi:hypothetical protein
MCCSEGARGSLFRTSNEKEGCGSCGGGRDIVTAWEHGSGTGRGAGAGDGAGHEVLGEHFVDAGEDDGGG